MKEDSQPASLPTVRGATTDDSVELAELANYAGEGLPYYLWAMIAKPGEDPWDIGRGRAARDTGSFSYRNCIVAENGGKIAGALIGYLLQTKPDSAAAPDVHPIIRPLLELEVPAADTWYINAVATYPEARGLGIGSALLRSAERMALGKGVKAMSLIVSDANHDAKKLYERLGYKETDRRPIIKEGWKNPGEYWLLMIKN